MPLSSRETRGVTLPISSEPPSRAAGANTAGNSSGKPSPKRNRRTQPPVHRGLHFLMTTYRAALLRLDCPAPTARRLRHNCHRWEICSGNPHLTDCQGFFDRFRRCASDAGYSPVTIESTISDVRYVAGHLGIQLPPGRRLRIPAPCPTVPSLDTIGRLYEAADTAVWPRRLWCDRGDWWRCLVLVVLWTGLRRGDLVKLKWADIGVDDIRLEAGKTKRVHHIPLVPTVSRHLAAIRPPREADRVFELPRSNSFRAFARQLDALATAASVPRVTLQQIRRTSITLWTSVNAEAGRLIHGCGLGVMAHYLDPLAVLRATAQRINLPDAMWTDLERLTCRQHRQELLALYSRTDPTDRETLLQVARKLAQ